MAKSSKKSSSDDKAIIDSFKLALSTAAKESDSSGPAFAAALNTLAPIFSARPADAIDLCVRAAKGSDRRAWVLCDLWLERGARGCGISDAAIVAILSDPSHPSRDNVMGHIDNQGPIEYTLRHTRFAPQLRAIARDQNDPHWAQAVVILCRWLDREALDILIDQTRGVDTPFVVLNGLIGFKAPEAVIVFEMNLKHPEPRTRTFALWGLAALNYDCAVGALVGLLNDPDVYTETPTSKSWTPGQSMRAAQALADVLSLPFEWADQALVDSIKAHCAKLYSPADVARCQADLAAGRFVKHNPPSS